MNIPVQKRCLFFFKNFIFISVLSVLLSCQIMPNKEQLSNEPLLKLHFEEVTLTNGLKIFFLDDPTLPRISLQAIIKVGAYHESQGSYGINNLLSETLDRGAGGLNSKMIAEQLSQMGTSFSSLATEDATFFSSDCLTPEADSLIRLFATILTSPQFAEDEINQVKVQLQASIRNIFVNPALMSQLELRKLIYRSHPYGRPPFGSEQSLKNLKREQLVQFYKNYYRPEKTVIVVSGQINDETKKVASESFAIWKNEEKNIEENPRDSSLEIKSQNMSPQRSLIDEKKVKQSQVYFSFSTVPRSHSDHLALVVASEVLGGGFSSRLMKKIRNELGLTYSISSSVEHLKHKGSLKISVATDPKNVSKVEYEIEKIINDFTRNGVTQDEIDSVKKQILFDYYKSIETIDGIGSRFLHIKLHELPAEEVFNLPQRLEKINVENVNRVIQKYLLLDRAQVLIYGGSR